MVCKNPPIAILQPRPSNSFRIWVCKPKIFSISATLAYMQPYCSWGCKVNIIFYCLFSLPLTSNSFDLSLLLFSVLSSFSNGLYFLPLTVKPLSSLDRLWLGGLQISVGGCGWSWVRGGVGSHGWLWVLLAVGLMCLDLGFCGCLWVFCGFLLVGVSMVAGCCWWMFRWWV